MSGLTQEQFDGLPDYVKADYQQTDDGFKHGGFLKLKESLNVLDGKYKTTEQRLSEIEAAKKSEIEAAELAAYEKAKKEGNVEEVEKRYQQQLADAQKRAGETVAQFEARLKSMADNIRTEKVNALVSDISAKHATDSGREAFKQILKVMVDFDAENNKQIFKGLDGSATSLDLAGFEADLKNNPIFAPLLKGTVVTNGGGNVNGGSNGSQWQSKNPFKKGADFNLTEQARLIKESPELAANLKLQA